MDRPRIIVAPRLLSYREAVACALRALRPEVEVIDIDPEDLDSEVSRLTPQVVICSHATSAVRHIASSWIELYREHVDLLSYVSVGGEPPRVVDGMELADLLSIIDRALSLQPV
jgi:hypothetical protein